jgi:hypothetical protein
MRSSEVLFQSGPISDEFASDLGDRRRSVRLERIVEALSDRPSESFPEVFEDPSELEAVYRLLGNDAVSFEDLLSGHVEATRQRVKKLERVAVIHDTTEFNWPLRQEPRWGLSVMSKSRQGFLAHVSLVVSADGLRCPVGCVRMRPFIRADKLATDDERAWWSERYPPWDSELDRWGEAVTATEEQLGDDSGLIHVMDREGDAYELFHLLRSRDCSFVIRLGQVRRVVDPATGQGALLGEVLERADVRAERTVTLCERIDAGRRPDARKAFPARQGRQARLSIRACAVEVCRPASRTDLKDLAERVAVNVVEVVELEPPEGQEAVRWVLLTSEPIDTVEQVFQVVDLYRSRWLVEEYFKSVKTGCAYSKRQLESADTLLNALAVTLPIAWRLLALRHMERQAPNAPAACVVSAVQLELLRHRVKKFKWTANPRVTEVLRAVARLGGHLPRNGAPGWQTLGRGWTKLMTMEVGYRIAIAE